ncbi:NAD(P)H-dependent oxidoreductase [Cytophagaceae bacterium DM2B3-1]|uniref:NAD(P)H-dependent oxidoreductase n=1 Tax=Xanthocytophaga flava TaxID=3048013 RepID=A0ABT7CHU5_9BACT|nr:NAD(P)H-dependent oxidoreductase [Xanthocytophaga flavus]MDJ1468420.1 NAD(P)H-dependent oxidoreductase [Xanthocytophaga flavus]MDJ1493306.1 NAD(P)H-dependent oxidoreductase [Xanthocytophaga flavus]
MQFNEAINWRYAAKKMNGQPVPQAKIDAILEAIRLSASSAGLQPYEVIVISDPVLKAKVYEKSCPQPQIQEGSHLLVFASQLSVSEEDISTYMERIARTRNIPVDSLNGFSDSIKNGLLSMPPEIIKNWASRQAYIALGFGLVAAAVEEVDSCAMEGFNPAALDELLGLTEKNLGSVVLLALGYRDEEKDFLAGAAKVRKDRAELFTELVA